MRSMQVLETIGYVLNGHNNHTHLQKTNIEKVEKCHIVWEHCLWTLFENTVCEHCLWTLSVNTVCEHCLWTLFENTVWEDCL